MALFSGGVNSPEYQRNAPTTNETNYRRSTLRKKLAGQFFGARGLLYCNGKANSDDRQNGSAEEGELHSDRG